MAKLTKDEIAHVAKLSKLDLTNGQIEEFLPQLSSIIDYISSLSEVDTSGIEPTSQTTGLEDVYREDKVKTEQSLNQDETLLGTEETYNGYFKVGAILTERTDK